MFHYSALSSRQRCAHNHLRILVKVCLHTSLHSQTYALLPRVCVIHTEKEIKKEKAILWGAFFIVSFISCRGQYPVRGPSTLVFSLLILVHVS